MKIQGLDDIVRRNEIILNPEQIHALGECLSLEVTLTSNLDEYLKYSHPDSSTLYKIVLADEEVYSQRTSNLLINWKGVCAFSIPAAISGAVSAIQVPWLAPFVVVATVADFNRHRKVPLSPVQGKVIRAIWETGAHATADTVLLWLAGHGWIEPKIDTAAKIEAVFTQLSDLGIVAIVDGKPRLQDRVVIADR